MTLPLPLQGLEVVVTRPEGEDGPLSSYLEELGASALYWPVLQYLPPIDGQPLSSALARLGDYDWIVFTSPRAVESVVGEISMPPSRLAVATVGSATSAGLAKAGWPVDLEADPARGAALVAAMGEKGCQGAKVLFPASAIARSTIPRGLDSHGALVHKVIAYRTVPAELDREACRQRIESGCIAAVTFASPSAADGLQQALGSELFETLMSSAAKAAIGSTTAEALEGLGHHADAIAERSLMASLAEAVERAIKSHASAPRRP